jgi:hypothetical protein
LVSSVGLLGFVDGMGADGGASVGPGCRLGNAREDVSCFTARMSEPGESMASMQILRSDGPRVGEGCCFVEWL